MPILRVLIEANIPISRQSLLTWRKPPFLACSSCTAHQSFRHVAASVAFGSSFTVMAMALAETFIALGASMIIYTKYFFDLEISIHLASAGLFYALKAQKDQPGCFKPDYCIGKANSIHSLQYSRSLADWLDHAKQVITNNFRQEVGISRQYLAINSIINVMQTADLASSTDNTIKSNLESPPDQPLRRSCPIT